LDVGSTNTPEGAANDCSTWVEEMQHGLLARAGGLAARPTKCAVRHSDVPRIQ